MAGPVGEPRPGKRAQLELILATHPREVEGDLAHYFPQHDLRDLWRPRGGTSRLTWRRLAALVDWLPGESATKTAIRDALSDERLAELAAQPRQGHGYWSHGDLRLAAIEDGLNRLVAITLWLAGDRKKALVLPEPVRRPGVATKSQKRGILSAEGRAYLQHLRDNQGALPPGYKAVAVGGR